MSDKQPDRSRSLPRQLWVAVWLLFGLAESPALADVATAGGGGSNGTGSLSASARLDFILNIGEFIFFRVGTSAYPATSATVDTVSFNSLPTIPAGAVVPLPGNNTTVIWNGAVPTFTATSTSLPVEVRSNAGQISVFATATSPLTSGGNNIPLSQIVLTSSDGNLPAPGVPDAGAGPAVNVTGTSFSNLVTQRSANWIFSFNPSASDRAGVYAGQISFTASSP